ncbi:hypothetical protein PG984_003463 [Apiospora sp. TS-2023a]
MAILDELPALKVTVKVNGKEATEYEYPTLAGWQDAKRIKPDLEPLTTCLIESRIDAEFVVRVELNEDYTWYDLPHSIGFQLFIDGERVGVRSQPGDDEDEGYIDIGAGGFPCRDMEGPGFEFHDHICYKITGERKGAGFKFASIKRELLEDEGSVIPRSPQKKHSPEDSPKDSPKDSQEASITVEDDEYLHEWVQILKRRLSEVEEERAKLTGGIAAIEARRRTKRQRIALEPEQSTDVSSLEPDAKKQCRHANGNDNSDERDDVVITPASPASD